MLSENWLLVKGIAMKTIVIEEIEKAVEILYSLDIHLSNHFVGIPDHPNDEGVAGVRQTIRQALDALHLDNWLLAAEKLTKTKKNVALRFDLSC